MNNPNWWRENYGVRIPEDAASKVISTTEFLKTRYGLSSAVLADDSQRAKLHGFTTAELIDLDVLSVGREDNVRQNNLEGRIYKAFARENWETEVPPGYERKTFYKLGNDSEGRTRKGNWVASNLVVWTALVPCLRLASKFIENAHLFPWIDALLYGQEPVSEIGPRNLKHNRIVYRTRKGHNPTSLHSRLESFLTQVADSLKMGLCSGHHNPTNGRPSLDGTWGGVTILSNYDLEQKSRIYLAHEIIEPLLHPDLRPSTQLALQFHVAVTVLHEFMHVLAHNTEGPIDRYTQKEREPEFFFENETISEVGVSFETAIFGAYTVLVLRNDEDPSYSGRIQAGVLAEDWFSKQEANTSTALNSVNFKGVQYRPVPISFLEELGQKDFWKYVVSTWGAEALKIYPLNEGRIVYQFQGTYQASKHLQAPKATPPWVLSAQNINSREILNPENVRALELTKQRINRGTNIMSKIKARRGIESIERSKNKPWNVRLQHLKKQQDIADAFSMECQEHIGKVEALINVLDKGEEGYPKVRAALARENIRGYKLCREWLSVALNDDIFDQFSVLKALHESYHDVLGIELSGESPYEEVAAFNTVIHHQCAQSLEEASSYFLNGDNANCVATCKKVLGTAYASTGNLADGNFILAYAANSGFKVWHATEAVRLYRHQLREDNDNDNVSARDVTQRKLDIARKTLKLARGDRQNFIPPALDYETAEAISGLPKSRRYHERSVFKADSELISAERYQGSHQPRPNLFFLDQQGEMSLYNQQERCLKKASSYFDAKNFKKAESEVLELMALPDLAPSLRAECHMCLACIPFRRDHVLQARSAWLRFRELEATASTEGGEQAANARRRRERAEEFTQWLKWRDQILEDSKEDVNTMDEIMLGFDVVNSERKFDPHFEFDETEPGDKTNFLFGDDDVDKEDETDALSGLDVTDEDMSPLSETERKSVLGALTGFVVAIN